MPCENCQPDPQVVTRGLRGGLLHTITIPAALARSLPRGCRVASSTCFPSSAPQAKQPVLQHCRSPSHPGLQGGQPYAQLPQKGRVVDPHGAHCAGDDARLVHLQCRVTHCQLWAASPAEACGGGLRQQLYTCKTVTSSRHAQEVGADVDAISPGRRPDCCCCVHCLLDGRCAAHRQAQLQPVCLNRWLANNSGHMPVC